MEINQEEFDILCQYPTLVIKVEEVDSQEEYKKKVCEVSKKHTEAFLEQIKKRLSYCKNESDIAFVEHTTLTFLLHSLGELIVDFDFDHEQIDLFANAFRDKILSCKTR